MFRSTLKRIRTGAVLAIAAALTVGGVAAAQQGGGATKGHPSHGQAGRHPQGPPPGGLPTKGLTYAELHVEHNKEAKVIRVDQGKVLSASESSITLSENDGSEVTVPVGSETKVLGKPGSEASLEDLKGKLVLVCGPSGGTAQRIIIEPKRPSAGSGPEGSARHGGPPPAGAARHGRPGGRR